MNCPKCGNEYPAKANVPKPLPNRYCAKCDYEWREDDTGISGSMDDGHFDV